MEAELGHNPSYVWRSLLAARDIIRAGSQWKVGDGRRIKVAVDKWLSHKPVFVGEDQTTMLVSELIDDDTGQWNRQKVHELFAPRTRCEILAMPLNATHRRDELVWKENRARRFLVKIAYQVALRLINQDGVEHSDARMDGKVWKTIWALKAPPKVRNFIWRACSNVLPTRENLHRRRVKVDSRCDICCQQPESNSHLLWECPPARNVWAISKGSVQKCSNQVHDLFHLFRMLNDKLTKMELERWATTSWAIWSARNKFYFEKVQMRPRTIMDHATGLLEDYQRLPASHNTS